MASLHNSNYPKPTFSQTQIQVIEAICNAVFRSHHDGEADSIIARLPTDHEEWQADAANKLVGLSYSDLPNATDELLGLMGRALSPAVISELSLALTLLSTSAGTFVLAYGWRMPFYDIPLLEREKILQRWMTSRIETRRKIVRAFAVLALYMVYTYYPTPTDATGYPSPDRRLLYQPLKAPAYVYTFKQPEHDSIINTEVLIIGSGAGGGVAASVLSRGGDADAVANTDDPTPADGGKRDDPKRVSHDGLKCLVVEKGIYAPTGERCRNQGEGFKELYQSGGVMVSESGSISVLAGSVFGGGTTINWSGSLKTQHYVREQWAKQYGLEHFLSDDFAQSLEAVCRRMGVSAQHIKHNGGNSRLIKGSEKLGYHVDAIPQNTDGRCHHCGFCGFGCPYGEKQGTVETFMKDAAAAGTEFMSQTEVSRLLFSAEDDNNPSVNMSNVGSYTYSPERPRCIGAELVLADGSKCIALASKAVVVSGGSINTPAILLRSGLTNPNIGKNLHLHPVSFVSGYFKEKINPWDGAIMTAVSNVCENREGSYFGAKLETCTAFPGGQASLNQVWTSSGDHKGGMLEYNHKFTMIALTRDRDGGSVFIDAEGQPRINYDISPFDAASCLKGIVAACEVMLAAGAKRIATAQAGVPPFEVPDDHKGLIDPRWTRWIKRVEDAGIHCGWSSMASAHQMGSCCMGTSRKNSVIDPHGRVWDAKNLYVADASVFPTASGVNPMVTTMAVSHSISHFILQDLRA